MANGKTLKLHQVLALKKTVQPTAYAKLTELHRDIQKADQQNGFEKTYQKRNDEDIDRPAERKPVLLKADDILREWRTAATRWFDLAATHETANCAAKADVVVAGQKILEQVPVGLLMFLDKQLVDLENTIQKAATQDPGVLWAKDDNAGLHRSKETQTFATKKVPRNHVRAEATTQHAAQVDVWHEDVPAGTWTRVEFTGAMAGDEKRKLLERVRELILAVRLAREEANSIDAPDVKVGDKIFDYLFAA